MRRGKGGKMNNNLWSRVAAFLKQRMLTKRWQQVVTCLAAVAVFGVTYALILPAITLTGPHPVLKADAIKAAPGEELEVEVQAKAGDEEEGTTFVLTALGDRAAVSDAYVFDEDGIALIKTKDDQEIELHRSAGRKEEGTLNYWFVLGAGEEAVFSLELKDQFDVDELVKVVSQGEYFTDGTKKDDTATNSNAAKAAAVVKATESDASEKASASNATPADATDEDGLLVDGDIVNDLGEEAEEEDANVTATLLLSAGSGKDLEDAVRDAEKNADKRGDAEILFKWVGEIDEVYEKSWSGSGVKVTLQYDEDAEIPADAVLVVNEVSETAEGYAGYVQEAEAVMSEAAGTAHTASSVKLYDIQILNADGTEIEPNGLVNVTITSEEGFLVTEGDEINVVHFAEDGAKVMELEGENDAAEAEAAAETSGDSQAAEPVKTLKFTTDSFSLYAVVTTKWNEGKLSFEAEDYTVTVSYTKEAGIPAGTELQIRELDPKSEEYLEALTGAWSAVNKEFLNSIDAAMEMDDEEAAPNQSLARTIVDSRFFDISFMKDGEELQPKVPVKVEISYKNAGMNSKLGAKAQVVHFGKEKTEVLENIDIRQDGGKVRSFTYDQSGFSVTSLLITAPTQNPEYLPPEVEAVISSLGAEITQELAPLEAHKTRTDNHDGTYTIDLTVKGDSVVVPEVRKANVLIMADMSGSMWGTDNATGHVNDYNTYIEWRQSELTTAQKQSGQYYGVTPGGNIDTAANRFALQYDAANDRFLHGTEVYTGSVFTHDFRWEGEKLALKALLSTLQNLNAESGVSDLVEVSFCGFDNGAYINQALTSNISAVVAEIDAVRRKARNPNNNNNIPPWSEVSQYYHQYIMTNWESATRCLLAQTNTIKNDASQAGEDLYVLFFTDGVPNRHMTSGYTGYARGHDNGDGGEGVNQVVYCLDEAQSIGQTNSADSKTVFFGIYTYGPSNTENNKNYLRRVSNIGNGVGTVQNPSQTNEHDGEWFFDAKNTTELQEALKTIADVIKSNVGYGDVTVVDGISTDAATTTVIAGTTTDPNSFKYFVDVDSTDAAGERSYSVTTSGSGADLEVIFKIGSGVDQETISGTAVGTGNDVYYKAVDTYGKEYRMSLAEINSAGEVTWDLGKIGLLKDGYTYKLEFIAWPNQETYDLLARLNNNLQPVPVWDDSIAEDGAGDDGPYRIGGFSEYPNIVRYESVVDGETVYTYAVLSNTKQYVDYKYQVEDEDGNITDYDPKVYNKQLEVPTPMGLAKTKVPMEKEWDDKLDQSELTDIIENYAEEHPGETYSVTLNVNKEKEGGGTELYKSFTFEPVWNDAKGVYEWPAQEITLAPGVLLTEERAAAIGLNTNNYTYETVEGVKYYVLEKGHNYTITEPDLDYHFEFESEEVRPMLVNGDLKFAVYKENGDELYIDSLIEEPLVFKGTNYLKGGLNITKVVNAPNVTPIMPSIGDLNNELFTINATLTRNGEPVSTTGAGTPNEGVGYRIIYGRDDDRARQPGEDPTPEMPHGRSPKIAIVNGTFTQQIYPGDTIRVGNLPSSTMYEVEESGQAEIYDVSYAFSDEQKIVRANDADEVTVNNAVYVRQLKVFKTDAANNSKALAGAEFDLYGDDYYDATGKVNPDAEKLNTDPFVSDSNGIVTVGYLVAGLTEDKPKVYYLKETKAPKNYYLLKEPIRIEVSKDSFQYEQADNALSVNGDGYTELPGSPDGYQITVINTSGHELPHTGGPGTTLYTLGGMMFFILSALLYGFRRRHEERRAA